MLEVEGVNEQERAVWSSGDHKSRGKWRPFQASNSPLSYNWRDDLGARPQRSRKLGGDSFGADDWCSEHLVFVQEL
jgi:hypothetical protein